MTISIVALIFGLAGFLILWFATGKAQLIGVAILAAALTLLLAGLAGRGAIVIHSSSPTQLPSHHVTAA